MSVAKPNATFADDIYTFHWTEPFGVLVVLDRLHDSKGDLRGFISVQTDLHGKIQSPERFNVMAPTARRSLAKQLELRTGDLAAGGLLDWAAMLNQACELAMERWWEGNPAIDLAAVEPARRPLYLLRPFILDRAPNVIFGDGAAGKSSFALALAVAVASGLDVFGLEPAETRNVWYLDWEADEETHAERLRAICAAANIDVRELQGRLIYTPQHTSLVDLSPSIRRTIAERNIGFVINDSLGAARAGEPESAELTIRTLMAMRSWGVPVLALDHVTKEVATNRRATPRPFGSNYTWNLGRNLWHMARIETDDEDDERGLVVTLRHAKINRGRLISAPYVYRVRHDPGPTPDELASLSYDRIDAMTIPELAKRAPLAAQIRTVLRQNNRAMSVADIALALEGDEGGEVKVASLRLTLARHKEFVRTGDGGARTETLWGLRSSYVSPS